MKITAILIHSAFAYGELNEPVAPGRQIIQFEIEKEIEPEQIPEAVFRVTNRGDNDYKVIAKEGRCCTLSVGDYVKLWSEDRYFHCESCGWKEVTHGLFQVLEAARMNGRR